MIRILINLYKWGKSKFPDLIFYSGFIFVLSQVGAVLNFTTNLLIVPNYLSANELGLIAPVTQYTALGALPLTVVSIFVIKFVSRFEANNEWGKLKRLTRDLICLGGASTIFLTVVFVASFDKFAVRMGIKSKWILLFMVIHLFVSSWTPLVSILTRSMQRYFIMAFAALINPLVLMICAVVLLPVYGLIGYLVALIISTAAALGVSVYAIYEYFSPHKEKMKPYFYECKGVLFRYLPLFVMGSGSSWLWGFIPPFVIKHFLPEQDAAGFYFVQRLAMLPMYAVSSLTVVLLPILSSKFERKEGTTQTVKGTIAYALISGVLVVILLYIFSPLMFRLVPQWRDYMAYSKYIWIMAVVVIMGNVNSIISMDFASKWFFRHGWYRLPITYGLVILLYCLFGWGGVKSFVPYSIWSYVDNNLPRNIMLVLMIMGLRHVIMFLMSCYWYIRIWKDKENKVIGSPLFY